MGFGKGYIERANSGTITHWKCSKICLKTKTRYAMFIQDPFIFLAPRIYLFCWQLGNTGTHLTSLGYLWSQALWRDELCHFSMIHSSNTQTLNFKTQLVIVFFFPAVNHSYMHKQTMKNWNCLSVLKTTNHSAQTWRFDTIELNF